MLLVTTEVGFGEVCGKMCFSEWCEEGQFVCANARQCVEMNKVCDGTPDCPLGDDEKSCVTLGDSVDDNEVIPYNEEGIQSI